MEVWSITLAYQPLEKKQQSYGIHSTILVMTLLPGKARRKMQVNTLATLCSSNLKNFGGVTTTGRLKHLLPTVSLTGVDGHEAQDYYHVSWFFFCYLVCLRCDLGALPSFNGKRKNENDDQDVDRKKKLKSVPPRLLKKRKHQPLSPRNVINLNSDSDSTSKSLAGPSRSKGKQQATSTIFSSPTPPPPALKTSLPPQRQENPQNSSPTSANFNTGPITGGAQSKSQDTPPPSSSVLVSVASKL
jgi:hypothetical protein